MEQRAVKKKEVRLNLREIQYVLKTLEKRDPDNYPPTGLQEKCIKALDYEDRIQRGTFAGKPSVIIPASFYRSTDRAKEYVFEGRNYILIPDSIHRNLYGTGKIEVQSWFYEKEIRPKLIKED